jgi:hypothetical protein
VALWALAPTYPNYDSYFHLVWGRELLDGITPGFEAYAAPTQHPLWIAVAAVLGLVGEDADRLLVLLCLLSHAALILGAYRLGAAAFGHWPGVVGAVFVAASASFWLYAFRGYVDSPFLALVIWAAVLAAERRRGALALLVLAGLLRPEAWVLGGVYVLWQRRAYWAAAIAPALWALTDLLVTGDPLHSLHATSALAEDLGRERGIAKVPGAFAEFLWATVRPPVLLLGVVGTVLAIRAVTKVENATTQRGGLDSRRVEWIPLALLAVGIATFAGTGIFGLAILPRYLTVPAVALCVLAGYALAGWTALEEGEDRRRWKRASTVAVVLGVLALPILAPSVSNVRDELRFIRDSHDELIALLDATCDPITFPTYRLVPDARWHGADAVTRANGGTGVIDVYVVGTSKARRRFGEADGVPRSTNDLPRDPLDDRSPMLARDDRMFVALGECPGG